MTTNPEMLMESDQDFSLELQSLENPEGELHLRFFLPSGKEFALPAQGIAEVLQQSPEEIALIPNASPLLLGTINLRGKIVWVADLCQFLGDLGSLNTDRPTVPVIAIEYQEQVLGLAIDKIGDIDWLDVENLTTATGLIDSMSPFISGQWKSQDDKGVLNLLDFSKILRSARWAA